MDILYKAGDRVVVTNPDNWDALLAVVTDDQQPHESLVRVHFDGQATESTSLYWYIWLRRVVSQPAPALTFQEELEHLVNRHNAESESNTPDFVLATYLNACLQAFHVATNDRDAWYGHVHKRTAVLISDQDEE